MAEVRVNRELLTSVAEDLSAYHRGCTACFGDRVCPVAQRLARIKGLLLRSPVPCAP